VINAKIIKKKSLLNTNNVKPTVTMIVSPLKALMANQKETFDKHDLNTIILNRDSILQKDCDIVLVTPEFIMHNTDGDQLKKLNVSIIIVDECHLMISWGKLIIF